MVRFMRCARPTTSTTSRVTLTRLTNARDTGAETQPVPNPLSWWLHVMVPVWFQKLSTLVNHIVELPAPFLLLMPRRWRTWGGVIQVCCHV